MVAPSSPAPVSATAATGRMAAVQDMARLQRLLFEIEREFVRTATTLIYRVGEPELKYLLCQHIWESAGHARFLRERGRELSGFGAGESARPELSGIFTEAAMPADGYAALAGFYRVLKPALLGAYRHYLSATHHLADWPSRMLVEEFVADEERHAREMAPYLGDIAISLPTAIRQAGEIGHPLEDEIAHLLVHGILHLCGYDHVNSPEEEAEMRAREERYIGPSKHHH